MKPKDIAFVFMFYAEMICSV